MMDHLIVNRIKHNNMHNLLIVILVSFACIALMTGCASNAVNQYPSVQETSQSPLKVVVSTQAESPNHEIAQDGENDTLDDMIDQAEYLCSTEEFKSADETLRSALSLANKLYGDSGSRKNLDDYNNYTNAILGVYSELMPPEYLTDDITSKLNQAKLLESIDSIPLTDSDTLLQLLLKCITETKFDVPFTFNERVQKACMYYLHNNRATVSKWVCRVQYYLPTIQAMFAESGLPLDLAYLPLIESGFNPKAYSHAHASGLWQFIPSTGKLYGLRNNYWLDERRDPLKATISAISYMKKLYNDFANWHLVLAAYNCGEGNVGRAISKAGTQDYWKLKLPKETMNYVPLYLASIVIIKNLQKLGFDSLALQTPLHLDTVTINECIDMGDIAKAVNIDKDTLHQLNPHILHWCTPPDISSIKLYLPTGTTVAFQDFYNNLSPEKKVKWYRYKITSGDNLLFIAKKFKVSIDAIKTVNRMKGTRLVAGHFLFIPIPVTGTMPKSPELTDQQVAKITRPPQKNSDSSIKYKVKKGDTFWSIAELFDVSVDNLYQWNGLSSQQVIREDEILVIYQNRTSDKINQHQPSLMDYKVNQGDTPFSIAKLFNMQLDSLASVNGLDRTNPVIYAGEIIKVYKQAATTTTESIQEMKAPDTASTIKYKVQPGDNLFRISQLFGMELSQLRLANGLTEESTIKIGDILTIPSSNDAQVQPSNSGDQNVVLYEVKPGDNLWRIANTFGIKVEQLYAINNLSPDSVLMPGEVIKVTKAHDL